MKNTLTLLIGILFISAHAQNKHFDLVWNDTPTQFSTETTTIALPTFTKEYFVYNDDATINFIAQWDDDRAVNKNSIRIENVAYGSISNQNLGGIDKRKLPTSIKSKILNSGARGKNAHILIVSPLINENGVVKKVLSFDVSYNFLARRPNSGFKNSEAITSSVLASGNFYKFSVEESGIHRLSADFLNQIGLNTGNINPRKLKIYGNGGRMIPHLNELNQYYDVTENAITVVGEEDGQFNGEDYVLFYAEGPKKWNSDSQTHINAYTDKTYYYITVDGSEDGKRIPEAIQPTATPDVIITQYNDYQFHEVDNINIVKLGRRWFGEVFNIETEQTFDFTLPNIVTTEPVRIGIKPASISNNATSMSTFINGQPAQNSNGQPAFNFNFAAIDGSSYATQHIVSGSPQNRQGLIEDDVNLSSEDLSITLNYQNNGVAGSVAYLDYISVASTRMLMGVDDQFMFQYNDARNIIGTGEFVISNAATIAQVWDITDIWNVTKVTNDTAASNFSFSAPMGEIRQYIALDTSRFLIPSIEPNSLIPNQDLKGGVFADGDVEYIIISPESFVGQAERLADFHRNNSGMIVKVVTLKSIYTEFNTGNPDIGAIRNFLKYVYDNASTPENRIKYVCFFGDASYDYKDRIQGNTNIVPVYQAYDSFNLTRGYMTDDFYGMMDDTEGLMSITDRLDIALGRMLISDANQAQKMVDKTLSYYAKESYGRWRNTVTIISDDAQNNSDKDLEVDLDALGNTIALQKPFINISKIHSDAFVQQSSAAGERYPEVTEAIKDNIALGSLVVNYFGHGGEDGLAGERIFEKVDSQELTNACRLPLFITITCEYTRFDNPLRQTAGEFMFWNENGGAVSLLTTTRQIFQNVGVSINELLARYLFSYGSNEYEPISEALRLTKNQVSTSNKRTVFYIGDPALKLAIPRPRVNLTAINDVPITQPTDTLKALSKVKMAGNITDELGNLLSTYNGTVFSTIYDKKIQRQTLANDFPFVLDFETLGEIIFRGKAEVVDGNFEFEFVVPRDITIPVGNGRISFYAEKGDVLEDHTGVNEAFKVGELNENAPIDNEPPVVNLFMNDESFVSGGITNEAPFLLAKLSDENGINTASGIGHDIVAILDGDEVNPFVLNDYYETELNDYTRGIVKFPLRDLEDGTHTLSLKAWDVYNNSSTTEIQFTVFNENNSLVINNVLNYPNPFVSYTEFWFNHNSSSELDIMIQVFTVSGKVVRTLIGKTNAGASSKDFGSLSRDILWDGKDDFGDKLAKGVYVYKITVKSPLTNQKVEKFEKLVIL
ncbi:type IX secretion system sortase PorU [Kordia sp. YSTF-M3]|uniref:Type IX secretion system sortase PorU n=1 Tax=Kordia aestuariivivens TaxID=2759037 RepID=A0ABR7QAT2_9FLAO|nr:type IX secretion system sortase PorU [Kordia aestuariivivens]MBC8755686.1 type IX secretion system sortase PorU [Kordia aestuariivivens]